MNDIAQGMKFTIDVKSGLVEMPQRAVLMKGDENANRVTMALVDGETTVSLEGAVVTGTYVLAGIKMPLLGDANGNEATIILPDECYSASGRYELRMHVKLGAVKRTFLYITGYVESDGEGGMLDVEGVIPNIDDIIAQYAEMKAVTERTQEAADKANDAASRAPHVGTNGNWYVWNATSGKYVDTGTKATGPQGPKGDPGTMENVTITSINGLPEALSSLSQQIENKLGETEQAADSAKLGGKAASEFYNKDNLVFDDAPVNGSTNPITSGAVYSLKQDLKPLKRSGSVVAGSGVEILNTPEFIKTGHSGFVQMMIRVTEKKDNFDVVAEITPPDGFSPEHTTTPIFARGANNGTISAYNTYASGGRVVVTASGSVEVDSWIGIVIHLTYA